MGVIKRGILGGFSNKVANIVGSSWKGIAVIKSLPLSVANPNTAAQQAQRNKFTEVVAFAGSILTTVIKPLWDRFAQQMSGYNAFIQANIDFFDETGLATPASLITSRGSLVGITNMDATRDSTTEQVTVTWDNNSGTGNAVASDELYLVVWNITTNSLVYAGQPAIRSAATVTVTGEAFEVGNVIWTYAAFRSANGFLASNSSGMLTPEVV